MGEFKTRLAYIARLCLKKKYNINKVFLQLV